MGGVRQGEFSNDFLTVNDSESVRGIPDVDVSLQPSLAICLPLNYHGDPHRKEVTGGEHHKVEKPAFLCTT